MKDEKVNELYKLAAFTLKKYNVPFDEDLIQELVVYTYTKLPYYDESRGSWSTFVINCMYSKLAILYRSKNAKKRNCGQPVDSLDDTYYDSLPYYDVIPSDIDVVKEVHKKEILNEILPLVDDPLKMYLDGFTQKEIADKYGVSQAQISRDIKKNIQKIKTYCKRKGIDYDI